MEKQSLSDTENIDQISSAIQKGIDYLYDHQLPNGEFLVYMSGDESMQNWITPESSVFPSSLIGGSLLFLKDDNKIDKILEKTANFLRYQMGPGGTWNHFTNSHHLRDVCPQDADDTACVSSFLQQMGSDFPDSKNKQILLDNRRSDGLFYTWFTFRLKPNRNKHYWYLAARELKHPIKSIGFWHHFECSRGDVDSVVNANVLYYLGKRPETEPIISDIIRVIKKGKEADCDKWYRNPFTVYYFFSRNFLNGISELDEIRPFIIDRIKEQTHQTGQIGTSPLDTALTLSSLLNLGYNDENLIDKAAHYLILNQKNNGSWDRSFFYYGGPKKLTGFGSEELTTSFCLESLARCVQHDHSDINTQ